MFSVAYTQLVVYIIKIKSFLLPAFMNDIQYTIIV